MHQVPSVCPICGDKLSVTRLACPSCDTTIDGHFTFSRLEQLSPEQRSFVELFVACEGKLSWLAHELKIFYPTVRGRLEEVIRGLGYEVREAPAAPRAGAGGAGATRQATGPQGPTSEEQLIILRMVEAGTISAEEAEILLKALGPER
jgi:hypothetical protein